MAGIAGVLARFKQPKHVAVVADLPRNAMGKVQKNVLRERYAGGVRGVTSGRFWRDSAVSTCGHRVKSLILKDFQHKVLEGFR